MASRGGAQASRATWVTLRPCAGLSARACTRNPNGTGRPNYTEGSWCADHLKQQPRSPSTRVVQSREHRRKRERIVRQGPPWICSICGMPIVSADDMQLHHVVAVANACVEVVDLRAGRSRSRRGCAPAAARHRSRARPAARTACARPRRSPTSSRHTSDCAENGVITNTNTSAAAVAESRQRASRRAPARPAIDPHVTALDRPAPRTGAVRTAGPRARMRRRSSTSSLARPWVRFELAFAAASMCGHRDKVSLTRSCAQFVRSRRPHGSKHSRFACASNPTRTGNTTIFTRDRNRGTRLEGLKSAVSHRQRATRRSPRVAFFSRGFRHRNAAR